VRAAVVGALTALLVGRWAAVSAASSLWSDALGVGDTHALIDRLRLMLLATAFAAALLWCVGNFVLLYRSIGAVRVPRRLGNIEILEALPRRYLLMVVLALGALLAVALSHRAGAWWEARALAGLASPVGLADPVLGRDLSYYLHVLPWQRSVHAFVTLLSGIVLALVTVVYAAVGALRWQGRRLRVSDVSRKHLGGLLAAFALALLWGYRLEPAEYVAGIHGVPLDGILLTVRLPAARLLSLLALAVAACSLLWMWVPHVALVAAPWAVLALVSFAGHYVVPGFAASVRSPDELTLPAVEAARSRLLRLAFGPLPAETSLAVPGNPEPGRVARYAGQVARTPLWDASAATVFLNRAAPQGPSTRFGGVHLGVYGPPPGRPIYLGVREVDLEAVRSAGADLSWDRVHGLPYSYASGAAAVRADRVTTAGLPPFVPDVSRPDSLTEEAVPTQVLRPAARFTPSATTFAVVPPEDGVAGVRIGGPLGSLRRLALAWTLESPRLLTSDIASDTALLLWHRAVIDRLERFAPFARFESPYAVLEGGRLYWLAMGYVAVEGFAGTPRVEWRGRAVRYLRSSLVGVVEAWSGRTSVYLLPAPDPVSAAWAKLTPALVRPAAELPRSLLRHVRYPRELFAVQLALWRDRRLLAAAARGRGSEVGPGDAAALGIPDTYWWFGPIPGDSTPRLRLTVALETEDPPLLAAVAHGDVVDGRQRLTLVVLEPPLEVEGPSVLRRRLDLLRPAAVEGIEGAVRTLVFPDGVLRLQPLFGQGGESFDPGPRLVEVGVAWGSATARGATLEDALRSLANAPGRTDPGLPRWGEARRWFRLLDSARQAGNWMEFGRAYRELERLLGAGADSTP
jgi:hypothetical protein